MHIYLKIRNFTIFLLNYSKSCWFISCCFLCHDKIWNSLSDLVNILSFSLEMHSCWLADKVNWSCTLVFQLPSPSIRVGSKLLRCKKKFAPESICNGTLPYFLLLGPQTTDTQWELFSNIPNILANWTDLLNK